jgi:hypothetical protein
MVIDHNLVSNPGWSNFPKVLAYPSLLLVWLLETIVIDFTVQEKSMPTVVSLPGNSKIQQWISMAQEE